jgi:hypothetical protein
MRISLRTCCAALLTLLFSARVQAAETDVFTWPVFHYGNQQAAYGIVPVAHRTAGCSQPSCSAATSIYDAPPAPNSSPETTPESPSQSLSPMDPGVGSANLGLEQYAASGGDFVSVNDVAGGYIDNPVVGTYFRSRFDAAWGNKIPDRNEFFYAKCGCFQQAPGALNDPNAKGPPLAPEPNVDYQDVSQYLELAPFQRMSFFAEVPIRSINPDVNLNHTGLADMNAGFKVALQQRRDRYVTFQLRTYIPTGDTNAGLGVGHTSVEPGILFWRQISNRAFIQGEVRDWVPIGGSDFAGNIVRYGAGLGYDVVRRCDCRGGNCNLLRVTPIVEAVGWTIVNGQQFNGAVVQSTDGITIANLKLGTRITKGNHSIYGGWGFAMTHNTWYNDILRLEYRRQF